MAETAPPTRRRWFQFRLKSFFWLTLSIALAIVAAGEHSKRVKIERIRAVEQAGSASRIATLKRAFIRQGERLQKAHRRITDVDQLTGEFDATKAGLNLIEKSTGVGTDGGPLPATTR